MGMFKGSSSSASPNGGSTEGGGIIAQLFREHGKKQASPQFNTMSYDPGTQQYTTKMKNGGTASSRADGIAQRGKTKGRMI